jgi:D-alanine-D-alanine ligase
VEELVSHSSRTSDPIGTRELVKHLGTRYRELGLLPVRELSDEHVVSTWETRGGMESGTLVIIQLDSILDGEIPYQAFRRTPEWLHGEAVGASRAPLAMMEFALRTLRKQKKLQQQGLGILTYADEGRECRYSKEKIERASRIAARVIVLRPGSAGGKVITGARGLRKYQLLVEGEAFDLRPSARTKDVLSWTNSRLESMSQLSSRKEYLDVFVTDISVRRFPRKLPHRVDATLMLSYVRPMSADEAEMKIRDILGKKGPKWQLSLVSDLPAMADRKDNRLFFGKVQKVARELDITLEHVTSATPSVAGFVPEGVPVICGLGPEVDRPYTPQEAVQRSSFFQRTVLLAELLRGV